MPVHEALVILILDEEGTSSALASAARRAGHHAIVATGVDTALVILDSLLPDVVVIRAISDDRDRSAVARVQRALPQVEVRVVAAPGNLGDALENAGRSLN